MSASRLWRRCRRGECRSRLPEVARPRLEPLGMLAAVVLRDQSQDYSQDDEGDCPLFLTGKDKHLESRPQAHVA
jgi:hypothetical protein